MLLSESEQRRLSGIERELAARDPQWVARMIRLRPDARRIPRRVYDLVIALAGAWVSLSLALNQPAAAAEAAALGAVMLVLCRRRCSLRPRQ